MSSPFDEEMASVKSESFEDESFEDENSKPEPLPNAPVYDQTLRNNIDAVKKRIEELVALVDARKTSNAQYGSLKPLHLEAQKLRDFKIQQRRTVGFIGDSGVGKSSVINSLLDLENFARSGGDGAACTSVVTEFRYVDDAHKDPWTVEAHFMNPEEIKELLEELLRSFRLFFCVSDDEDKSALDERLGFEEESLRAWTTIQSILPDNEDITQDFLAADHEGAWDEIMDSLQEWANESISHRQQDTADLVMTLAADDLDGCKKHLDRLMAKSGDRENPPLWPFMNIVRVYIDRPILRTGLVLTDLPGFRDLNYARVRATEKYMRHNCDEVFIVSSIARCITDQSIVDIKRRCDVKPQNIICTRSEDISPAEEAHGETEYAEKVRSMNDGIKRLEKQIERTRKNRIQAMKGSKAKYAEKLIELNDDLEEKQLERKEFLVETRNDRVITQLNELYQGGKVFCVSNRLYAKYREGDSNHAEDYIALSGIGSLRQHCYLVPAETQLREVTAFLSHQVPANLGSLRQWILSGAERIASENASALRNTVDQITSILEEGVLSANGPINRLAEDLKVVFRSSILDYAEGNEMIWREDCLDACESWDDFHHRTYAAFCRRNGTFTSRTVTGYHCWNEELTECMRPELPQRWENLKNWLQGRHADLKSDLGRAFVQAYDLLRNQQNAAPRSMLNLRRNMQARQQIVNHRVAEFIGRVHGAMNKIGNDMCLGHDSSFMGTVMRPAYLTCSNERGRGSHLRRKAIIFDHIQTANIMFEHRWAADNAYTADINTEAANVTMELHQEVDGILSDLEGLANRSGKPSRSRQISGFVKDLKVKVDLAESALKAAQRTLEELVKPLEEPEELMEESEEPMEESEEESEDLMDAA